MESTRQLDDKLEGLQMKALKREFHSKADTMAAYTKEVKTISSKALTAANIRHPPITSRIKSWESAQDSLCRRYQECLVRRRLRDKVEAQGRLWEEYIRETGMSPYTDEMESFKTPEGMLAALHDFGGMRISLYFPGDVERVATVLHQRFNVIRRIDKGHNLQANVQNLEKRLELLHSTEKSKETTADSQRLQRSTRTFTGYKATHFVVKLRDEDIPPDRKYGWKDVVIEIQVGTLVMHVWSEIEHDMIYKPLDSQGGRVSEDEERILDVINGIVLTGEAALRQLELSTSRRLNKRAGKKNATASSHYELATWIEKDCTRRGKSLDGVGWKLLKQLFAILKATGDDKHSEVTKLIEDAIQQTSCRQLLPTKMLQALCKRPVCSEWVQQQDDVDTYYLVQNARLWALRLVHSLNLAMYLGVTEEFLNVDPLPRRPSFASFLEIIHPDQAHFSDLSTAEVITNFCRALVDPKSRPGVMSNQLVRVAMDLPVTNMVVRLTESDSSRRLPVPGLISRLFPTDEITKIANGPDDASEAYRVIDFIDLYLPCNDNKRGRIVIRDRLAAQSANPDRKKVIESRFLVPVVLAENTSLCRWKLIDHDMQLQLQKIDSAEISRRATPVQHSKREERG